MIVDGYLNIRSNGTTRFTKNKGNLAFDEVAIKVSIQIPNKLFKRPLIEANIVVSEDILPKRQSSEIILNTKELIEQQTGVKIDFSVKPYDVEESEDAHSKSQ